MLGSTTFADSWAPGPTAQGTARQLGTRLGAPGPTSRMSLRLCFYQIVECLTTNYPPAYLGRTGAYCVYAVDSGSDRSAGQGTQTHSIDDRERTLNPRVQGSSPWGRTSKAAGQGGIHGADDPHRTCTSEGIRGFDRVSPPSRTRFAARWPGSNRSLAGRSPTKPQALGPQTTRKD
jgi:hypothetical protein